MIEDNRIVVGVSVEITPEPVNGVPEPVPDQLTFEPTKKPSSRKEPVERVIWFEPFELNGFE